jgi:tRNA threonylcarbamoyladenosine biosynthesis protein TsaB
MNRILAIETSAEACSVALSIDGAMREVHEQAPLRHAELLLPAITRLLADAAIPLSGLDAIAFGRGPGSFTSLRIGIGVVQGLAWGAGLPVVPQSSLAAVAQLALEQADAGSVPVLVAVDARMQEVFSGRFERGSGGLVRAVGDERVCAPGSLGAAGLQPFIAAGNGFARFAELQGLADSAAACYPDLWPRASVIARLAMAWMEENEPLPPAGAQPVYLRNDVAEKPA